MMMLYGIDEWSCVSELMISGSTLIICLLIALTFLYSCLYASLSTNILIQHSICDVVLESVTKVHILQASISRMWYLFWIMNLTWIFWIESRWVWIYPKRIRDQISLSNKYIYTLDNMYKILYLLSLRVGLNKLINTNINILPFHTTTTTHPLHGTAFNIYITLWTIWDC